MMRTRAWTADWLPIVAPEPRRYPSVFPMAPIPAAVRAIVEARFTELWSMPDPGFDVLSWFGIEPTDPLAPVRRELQAWLDGPREPYAGFHGLAGVTVPGSAS